MEESSSTLCRYFLHGACSKGSSCIYAHDLTTKANNVCKFYMSGSCSYGRSCRYDHVKPSRVLKPVIDLDRNGNSSTLVPLGAKKGDVQTRESNSDWVDAPTFIPGQKSHKTAAFTEQLEAEPSVTSYSAAVAVGIEDEVGFSYDGDMTELMCPFALTRPCPYGESCEYLHGDECEMCGLQCLNPFDEKQREDHAKECVDRHEEEMERAFAMQRSSGVACSVCLDIITEKSVVTERMFGLLENCNHPFCLSCIRKWRSSCHQETTVIRACPICRTTSWFVTPSEFWIEDDCEKKKIIEKYKAYLSTKPCRNFDQGKGECPFGTSCFYKHGMVKFRIFNNIAFTTNWFAQIVDVAYAAKFFWLLFKPT